jgi:hypothetical protein
VRESSGDAIVTAVLVVIAVVSTAVLWARLLGWRCC